MKTIKGDLIKLAQEGMFDVIAHGCNCFCTMGGGIAKQLKDKYPIVYAQDSETISGDKDKLGNINWVNVKDEFTVVNAYTQYGFGSGRQVDYDAVRKCFKDIKSAFEGQKIGYPMIGAGLAGGDWKLISTIIDKELDGEDHTLVVWDKNV